MHVLFPTTVIVLGPVYLFLARKLCVLMGSKVSLLFLKRNTVFLVIPPLLFNFIIFLRLVLFLFNIVFPPHSSPPPHFYCSPHFYCQTPPPPHFYYFSSSTTTSTTFLLSFSPYTLSTLHRSSLMVSCAACRVDVGLIFGRYMVDNVWVEEVREK